MTTLAPAREEGQHSFYSVGYTVPATEIVMTLRRLKLIAIAAPVAGIITLEIARSFVLGSISMKQRLVLDAIIVASIVLFSLAIFRFVEQMESRLKRQNRELLALHAAGIDVASELALDSVLKKVVDQARMLVGAKYGALSVIDDQSRIQSFVTSGITSEERAAIGPPPVGHGVLGVVLREGQSLSLGDIKHHPRSVGFPANHPHMKSLLAVPITCKGPFLGNLYLSDKLAGDGSFSKDDQQTLERFAVQAAIAIDNAHLHAQVADLAVAEERIRIAHEMHDGLAQVLGYVNTKVQAADAYLNRGKTEEATQQLNELARSARQAYVDVRESIIGLRALPNRDRPLSEALQEFFDLWEEQSGISIHFSIDDDLRLKPRVELQVVRIVQEALTNARKHARATSVRVDIRVRGEDVIALIGDDGVGFNQAARTRSEHPRFGLTTMRERAESIGGKLSIDSTPGRGTTVTFSIALREAAAEA
jgi:nitrate/nitrite-specific signal transduction histidine kinase